MTDKLLIFQSVGLSLRFTLQIQLVGIDYIMPHTVESCRNGRHRSEESVAHPDGKYRIFLPQGLSGADGISVTTSYLFPEIELQGTADQRNAS